MLTGKGIEQQESVIRAYQQLVGGIFHHGVNVRSALAVRGMQIGDCFSGVTVYLLQTAFPGSQPKRMFGIFQHHQGVRLIFACLVSDGERFKPVFGFIQFGDGRGSPVGNSPYLILTVYQDTCHEAVGVFELVVFQIALRNAVFEDALSHGGKPQVDEPVFSNVVHIGLNADTAVCSKVKLLKTLGHIVIYIDTVVSPYPDVIGCIIQRRDVIVDSLRTKFVHLYGRTVITVQPVIRPQPHKAVFILHNSTHGIGR